MQLPRKDLYIFLAFFYQAFDALLQKLQKYVPYESSVTDLYAGAGVIGLSLAATRKCR
jgi:tRNA/tmRNA/rRNA uracil-C5-methylase (TrmA/RlmC/RlmD family)